MTDKQKETPDYDLHIASATEKTASAPTLARLKSGSTRERAARAPINNEE
jgi:hypothetical protein